MDSCVIEDLIYETSSYDDSRAKGGKITCHPIPDTSTERLVQEYCLYGCFTLQNERCEVFEARHR